MSARWYPDADRSQDRSQFSGVEMPRITKCVLHSTETAGWPSYPTFAPQFTLDPWALKVRQHMAVNRSASTLADPSWTAVRENRDDVVQIEIIGYCDESIGPRLGKFTEALTPDGIRFLGKLLAWLHTEWGLPLTAIPVDRWKSYQRGAAGGSYGLNNGVRLTSAQFDAFTGILGHQHASGNHHGDPGHIAIDGILAAAKGIAAPEPKPEIDVRARLNAWGFRNPNLTEAIKDWQQWLWNYGSRSLADGQLGPRELEYLASDDSDWGTAPVLGDELGRPYGFRSPDYRLGWHTGDDWRAEHGDPVRCTRSGVVVKVGRGVNGPSYGNTVVVRTSDGIDVTYNHLSRIDVNRDQRVSFTQRLGLVGSSGYVQGPHLHYEECPAPWTFGKQRKPVWDRSPANPY